MARGYQPGSAGHLLVTGASGGIGAALARLYAAPGVRLSLQGRDAARLEGVAADCRGRGAEVATALLDVADHAACSAWVEAADAEVALDLVVANAGVSGGKGPGVAARVMAVNVGGVLATAEPALARMAARGRGQVALVSSIASFRGTPQAPAYCASKAAVRLWGEGLRGRMARDGVAVSVVCPGFVRTAMTAGNRFPMPMIMDADRAAAIIARGLAAGSARIAFPWPLYAAARLFAALPPALGDRLIGGFRRKE